MPVSHYHLVIFARAYTNTQSHVESLHPKYAYTHTHVKRSRTRHPIRTHSHSPTSTRTNARTRFRWAFTQMVQCKLQNQAHTCRATHTLAQTSISHLLGRGNRPRLRTDSRGCRRRLGWHVAFRTQHEYQYLSTTGNTTTGHSRK